MYKLVVLSIIIFTLAACNLNQERTYTPPVPADEHGLETMSALFTPGAANGVIRFKTNDSAYYSNKGYTLWCLLDEEEPSFTSRETEVNKLTGNMNAGYGLVYCYRNDPEYGETMLVVMINATQEYIVAEVTNNIFHAIASWKQSTLLKDGYNQVNGIRLEYNNDDMKYNLYFNNILETTFTDDEAPFHTSGRQGYIVVISPLDDFPGIPVEIVFKEKSE